MNNKYICEDPFSEHNYSVTGKIFDESELGTDDFGNKKSPDGFDVITLDEFEEKKKKEKDEKRKKLIKLIAVIAAAVLLIGGLLFFITGGSSDKKIEVKPTMTTIEDTTSSKVPVKKEEPVAQPEPTPVKEETKQIVPVKVINAPKPERKVTSYAAPKGTQSLSIGGNSYKGEVLNGKPHGIGTMYYKKSTLISPKDLKKRMAESGDYLTGEFYEGNVVQGKLFDASNNVKEVIMIGR